MKTSWLLKTSNLRH